jgi:hypothetical protein
MPELKAGVQEESDNLDQAMLDELFGSMPWRFKICIEKHGKTIYHCVRNLTLLQSLKVRTYLLG